MKTKNMTIAEAVEYLGTDIEKITDSEGMEANIGGRKAGIYDIPLDKIKEAVKRKYHKELVRTTMLPYKEIHEMVRALDFSF